MAELEVCISSDDLTQMTANINKVYLAGAQRIELCSAMESDGLTPNLAAVSLARQAFKERAGLMVMIRPRAGDFHYDEKEVSLMLKQIQQVAEAGADGVVLGALNEQSSDIAVHTMKRLMSLCKQLHLQVGFHRAFDVIADRGRALKQLIELKVDRVLTSGTTWGDPSPALSNIKMLENIINLAQEKIGIVIAGSIDLFSARAIYDNTIRFDGRASFHSYSGVLSNGEINQDTVKAILKID